MGARFALLKILIGSLLLASPQVIAGQPPTNSTETQAWPEFDLHAQFPAHLRLLAFSGLEQGVDYPYQQWYSAAGLGYQFRPILRPHIKNIDPDKEFRFVLGVGYEFLHTIQSGKLTNEQRMTIEFTPGFRLPAQFLVRDRNWTELRWINGKYSTTYRNMLSVERDFLVGSFRFSPYGSAEAFYDAPKRAWNQQWYTAGIQCPYKYRFMLDTYYRRETCSTCLPANWNVAGVTFNVYIGKRK